MNAYVEELFSSGVSQRRIAKTLKIHKITVARKLTFLSLQARLENESFLSQFLKNPFRRVQFDEMETFEHSKCKPLSIALLVSDEPKRERVILGSKVSVMPAKGPLAQIAREKYGFRADLRSQGIRSLFEKTKPLVASKPQITSDQNPRYPKLIKDQWVRAEHIAVQGKRGCIVGQGELKKIGFDPLFSLNHTAAMLRANINRLFRRTWCTTKKLEALEQHIQIYIAYHNRKLLKLAA